MTELTKEAEALIQAAVEAEAHWQRCEDHGATLDEHGEIICEKVRVYQRAELEGKP